jgi:hypothetical protein
MQLGVGVHANHPCSIQCPLSPGAQYTHARWPARVRTTQGQRAWVYCAPGERGHWMLHGWFA